MACTHAHAETMARFPADADPTRSKTLRRRYAQRLRGYFGRLNATIREAVVENDLFGLRTSTLQEAPSPPGDGDVFRFGTNAEKRQAFRRWLREQHEQGLLEIVTTERNEFVRSAYEKGMRHADRALAQEGATLQAPDIATALDLPVQRQTLRRLYARNFRNLRDVTREMDRQISETLAEGFRQGENPTKIARRITDRVDAVGKHRATVLARTEVINAHATATLDRYEQQGVGELTVQAEWSTAGDRRVCPICQSLEGNVYTIQQARNGTFRFEADEDQRPSLSGTYPIKPPAHPQCRCAFLPVVS